MLLHPTWTLLFQVVKHYAAPPDFDFVVCRDGGVKHYAAPPDLAFACQGGGVKHYAAPPDLDSVS